MARPLGGGGGIFLPKLQYSINISINYIDFNVERIFIGSKLGRIGVEVDSGFIFEGLIRIRFVRSAPDSVVPGSALDSDLV